MSWTAVHQFVPTLIRGDAIGDHVVRLRDQQRAMGRASEIFVDVERDATAELTRPLDSLDRHVKPESTLLVYHVAQASRCAAFLLDRSEPLALLFHNFTPVDLLAGWDPSAACDLLDAERQLADLAGAAIVGICDSQYNAGRLADHGLLETHVACIPVAAPTPVPHIDGGPPTVLFVGRVAPNKAFHDLVAAAAVLRHRVPGVRFRLVGGTTSERYTRALISLVQALDLEDTVTFTGRVSDSALLDEYRAADAFCCLSDHEGFGVPLLEAMSHGLPVVAFDSSAVGETVGGAGLLLADKDPTIVATALERVLTEPTLAAALTAAGYERAASFSDERCAREIDAALDIAWRVHAEHR
ncbi:MAG: glycosyltransferase [Actinomycetota bacterium]|nr:glycosyltransferase [Actinomycetota bacterium]